MAHWRGELSLSRSVWLHGLALSILAGLVLGSLTVHAAVGDSGNRLARVALLLAWPLALAAGVWGGVGVWRAAGRQARLGGADHAAAAARLLVVLGAAALLASAAVNFVPAIAALAAAPATGSSAAVQGRLSDDGRRFHLSGVIEDGVDTTVGPVIERTHGLRVLELDLRGDHFPTAARLAEAVRRHGLITRVTGRCDDACVLVQMAGVDRQAGPDARFVFARAPVASFNPLVHALVEKRLANYYVDAGLTPDFAARALDGTRLRPWNPDNGLLLAAGLVSRSLRPLDVAFPPDEAAAAPAFVDRLAGSATWLALERRFPGTLLAAATQMAETRRAGGDDEAMWLVGQRVASAHLPRLLFDAGPALRADFLALLRDQLDAALALEPGACTDLLAGDAAVRRRLPAALAEREAAWLAAATTEPVRARPARAPTTLELEIVRRTLGTLAQSQLSRLWQAARSQGIGCERAAALIDELTQLPPAERRLAVRLVFERSP